MVLRRDHHDAQLDGACHRRMNQTGFDQTSWLPLKSWSYSGGDYAIGVRGDRFLIAERAKLRSVDELDRLLRKEQT